MPTQTFTFTLRVVDAEGRVATVADSIQVFDAPVGVTPVISLQPRTIFATGETTRGVSRTISASFTLAATGRLSTSEGVTSASEWGVNVTGADYQARFTPLAGAAFSGTPVGAWTAIDALSWTEDLTATAATGQPVSQLTSGTLEIRDVATQTVRATAVISFDLRITVIDSAVRLSNQLFRTLAESFSSIEPEFNFYWVQFLSNGRLRGHGRDIANNQHYYVPNEWGPDQNSSAHEVRFTVLTRDYWHANIPGSIFGVWHNIAFSPGYGFDMHFNLFGYYDTTSTVLVEIRPVGGAVVASAVHTINLTGSRFPGNLH